jgi:DNA-directed RNA polymerase subunit beta'
MGEIEHALDSGAVTLHAKVKARTTIIGEDGREQRVLVETTPGRMKLAELLPKHPKTGPALVANLMTKKEIGNLIDAVYRHTGQKATVIFADRLMALGFREAAKAGISFGMDDMIVPKAKIELVNDTRARVGEYEQQYADGLITKGEKYNKVVDAWSKCTDKVADAMMEEASQPAKDPHSGRSGELNSVFMMAHSGARGSKNQMKQLAGMRGLMAKPSGEIIETPIISNFKEGLTVLEYFNSTHGARKGLADTALKTANSGYLTRRLVDVAQDCIITEEDCGSTDGIQLRSVIDGAETVVSLGARILGRTAAEDILDPRSGELVLPAHTYLDEQAVVKVETAGVQAVKVRSVLTCQTRVGVCGACYGRDLARGTRVNIGEAVGVIAAQSIGEPGTQLTMRTFHIGGAAQVAEQSVMESAHDGVARFVNRNTLTNAQGDLIVMGRNMQVVIEDAEGKERQTFKIPYGAKLKVREGGPVKRADRISEWDPYSTPIITEMAGRIRFLDLVENISIREEFDDETGISSKVVIDWRASTKGSELKPSLVVEDVDATPPVSKTYMLPVGAILSVGDGDQVKPGQDLARITTGGAKTRDITGGLPRVAELFEARRPKDHAIIAEIDGRVEFGRDYKNKRRLRIVPEDESKDPAEYMIPKGKHIAVQEGDMVKQGDYLLDGNPAPQDILSILGVEALAAYLVEEIQKVYRLQGVPINDKHIEVIVRQMLQKVEVMDAGDTEFLKGEAVDSQDLEDENRRVQELGLAPATAQPMLLGITKASLQTRSFISAASFQETTRVLTEAATYGKTDSLEGLKENVIVGRLIPAGTGGQLRRYQKVAAERDAVLLEEVSAADAAALEARQPQAAE